MTPSPEAFAALDRVERRTLAFAPTPILEVPALAAALGLHPDRLLVKMDAWTGFGLGGNKVRKLEYELAPERLDGITCLVTAGGAQSNHCRVTAAAAAHLGLRCILVLNGPEPSSPRGNAILHRLLGAEIRIAPRREDRDTLMAEAAAEVERAGGRARVIPLGASTPLGALGYVRAAREFLHQLRERDGERPTPPTRIVLSTSSGGTLSGLVAGLHLAGATGIDVRGISADISPEACLAGVEELSAGALEILREHGAGELAHLGDPRQRVQVSDAFVGEGYAIPTPEGREALELFARKAGILLDPTYTAKAAAGLLAAIRQGVGEDSGTGGGPGEATRWVFWHTGGHPALLA